MRELNKVLHPKKKKKGKQVKWNRIFSILSWIKLWSAYIPCFITHQSTNIVSHNIVHYCHDTFHSLRFAQTVTADAAKVGAPPLELQPQLPADSRAHLWFTRVV